MCDRRRKLKITINDPLYIILDHYKLQTGFGFPRLYLAIIIKYYILTHCNARNIPNLWHLDASAVIIHIAQIAPCTLLARRSNQLS